MKRWLKRWASIQTASNYRNKFSIKNEAAPTKSAAASFFVLPEIISLCSGDGGFAGGEAESSR